MKKADRYKHGTWFRAAAFTLLMIGSANAGSSPEPTPRPVVFLPQWSPQAQFAGYYVADAKGIYKRLGLALEVLRGGPDRPADAHLAAGRADFATLFLTTGIAMRAQGVPVVNVAQIVQRSALMLVTRKDSGIVSPEDFRGKRVSVWEAFQIQPTAFFRRHDLDVIIVPQGYTLNLFLMGGVDAASAMWYNEYYTLLHAGMEAHELNTFFLADHDLNFPEDGIYCLEETIRRDPQTVHAFVQGSIEGWRYAFEHPREALEIVMAYVQKANLPTNRLHQQWMLERMRDVILPTGNHPPLGTLQETDYHFVARQLWTSGIIPAVPGYSDFYDNRSPAQ